MTKIDESKQYKFSEIIAMLENKELPAGTAIRRENKKYGEKILEIQGNGLDLVQKFGKGKISVSVGNVEINSFWSIKLPKEDKFYLKAPDAFKGKYLNLHIPNDHYFLSGKSGSEMYQTQFTKKEIDAMPFDTNFFEKAKVDQ
ncbi:hypothetical protein [Carnobacterium maltaromaticum]